MKNTIKHLLFLNPLSSKTLEDLNTDPTLKVSCQALIKIRDLDFDSTALDPNIPWIVTSQNAAKRIQHLMLPKTLYCIGQKTASYFNNTIYPKVSNAKNLAQLIIQNNETKLIYVCGQQRREELPKLLKHHSIELKEVKVYETLTLKKSLNLQSIDGLAFMSPSAVYSFQENAAFMHQICFAIGKSTAQALKDIGQDCIISKQTHAKSIVDAARQYFNR